MTEHLEIAGASIEPGESRTLELPVAQSYRGIGITLPVRVVRAERPGPTVLVTAAIHGDEINGTGIIRSVALDPPFDLSAGTLVLVPVVNLLGFERHSRYLPDRRDLNRCFPGDAGGSATSRFAAAVWEGLLLPSDYLIDLHTAAVRRTNFPNIRADMSDERVAKIARAFGVELIVDGCGPASSFRREACKAGKPAIILEAGEALKIEPTVVELGVRGIRNVLVSLGMVEGGLRRPIHQAVVKRKRWIRAPSGGLLQFHVAPGEPVSADQPVATVTSLLGRDRDTLLAPFAGIVLGMTTLPAVSPGDPVCHLGRPVGGIRPIRAALEEASGKRIESRVRDDLATNVVVSAPRSDGDEDAAEGD